MQDDFTMQKDRTAVVAAADGGPIPRGSRGDKAGNVLTSPLSRTFQAFRPYAAANNKLGSLRTYLAYCGCAIGNVVLVARKIIDIDAFVPFYDVTA